MIRTSCAQQFGRYEQLCVGAVRELRSINVASGGDERSTVAEQSAVQRKSDAFVGRYRGVFLRALRTGQRHVSVARVKEALDAKDTELAERVAVVGLRAIEVELNEVLPGLIMSLLAAAGNVAGAELPLPPIEEPVSTVLRSAPGVGQPAIRFDKTNPDAIDWAERYASGLVRDITAESRDAINHVIAKRLASGASTQQAAKAVQMSVGLTEPHAAALLNLNAKLLNSPGKVVKAGALQFRVPVNGMTRKQLDAALSRYAERLTKVRAANIARTATRTASSEGQRQMWRQARGKGLLTGAERRQWIAGAKACKICSAMDGETASLEGTFSGGIPYPPAHGSCTCTQSLTYDR